MATTLIATTAATPIVACGHSVATNPRPVSSHPHAAGNPVDPGCALYRGDCTVQTSVRSLARSRA
jgi:hypothetical protein